MEGGGMLVAVLLAVIVVILVVTLVVIWNDGGTRVVRRRTLKGMRKTHNVGVTPTGLAVTGDGAQVFVTDNNNYTIKGQDAVSVIHTATGKVDLVQDASFVQPYTVTIDTWDKLAYVSNSASPLTKKDEGTVTVLDVHTHAVTDVLTGFDGPSGVALLPDGKTAYVINYGAAGGVGSGFGNTVSVVDLASKAITATITVAQAPAAIALTPDGSRAVVVSYFDGNPGTGKLTVIDTATNAAVAVVSGFSGPFSVVVSPDGWTAYVTNFGSNNFMPFGTTVSVVSLADFVITGSVTTGIQPSGAAVSPCGGFLYVSNYNTLYTDDTFTTLVPGAGTVSVIDVGGECPKVVQTVEVDQSPGNVALSPCGTRLYVSNFTSNTVSELRVGSKD